MGQDIREKFSGAVEAFSRRNTSASGRPGEHSRHRTLEDGPSSKDVVFSHVFFTSSITSSPLSFSLALFVCVCAHVLMEMSKKLKMIFVLLSDLLVYAH